MQFTIYHLLPVFAEGRIFRPFRRETMPDRAHYHRVFEGSIDHSGDQGVLRLVFAMMNRDERPSGYTGRSLSVSDVVVLEGYRAYYCDTHGWAMLKDWQS